MIAQLKSLGKAEAVFRDMTEFVKNATKSKELRIDEVEEKRSKSEARHPAFLLVERQRVV